MCVWCECLFVYVWVFCASFMICVFRYGVALIPNYYIYSCSKSIVSVNSVLIFCCLFAREGEKRRDRATEREYLISNSFQLLNDESIRNLSNDDRTALPISDAFNFHLLHFFFGHICNKFDIKFSAFPSSTSTEI